MANQIRVRVRQCYMQLMYEVDSRRKKLLTINVGKYLSAFPVIWLTGLQAMQKDSELVREVCAMVVLVVPWVDGVVLFLLCVDRTQEMFVGLCYGHFVA